jgi:hypothetical protein
MAFQLNHLKQGKRSNALVDFKLENASITVHDLRLMPQTTKEQLLRNITEKIKYPDGVDEEFVKTATLISMV